MVELVSVYEEAIACRFLYEVLKKRTPEQSISHKKMPSLKEHAAFFHSHPYLAWYLIKEGEDYVGSTYLTKNHEIGIFILNEFHGNGYGDSAVKAIMQLWDGPFYANINPDNVSSIDFFKKLGAKHIQNTYLLND
ncbi:MAG TPA: N-acetyltransferase [bacterium]|nr:N-acetyltransferase [bacterium]